MRRAAWCPTSFQNRSSSSADMGITSMSLITIRLLRARFTIAFPLFETVTGDRRLFHVSRSSGGYRPEEGCLGASLTPSSPRTGASSFHRRYNAVARRWCEGEPSHHPLAQVILRSRSSSRSPLSLVLIGGNFSTDRRASAAGRGCTRPSGRRAGPKGIGIFRIRARRG